MAESFFQAYVTCAVWISHDGENGEINLDEYEGDIAPESLAAMERECAAFQEANATDLELAYEHETIAYDEARAGHDFWLTRNGHGAGFRDRGLGSVGDRLTAAAKTCGERYLYIGDDGQIHQG